MIFSNRNQESISVNQASNKQKSFHPLLRPLVNFWKFSCYYADYKARVWDLK
ncbi:hypothetical protein IQ230_17030 [Gloeocapsopsis crepidinum LEGE 06123]|uniref:Uncharacterized protein n=1 Tax=Gloeocapsopsis crepidinum LEGE 06123 TaxID=588587 RepID=A0ABR9UUU5_9CHRO|nr:MULTISPECIES: hypothetical protein [Gloeocapsopsis]MBE9192024.1 hypothetical protein [Gloeocapsopsis crepidinum LEGE 06123]